jgi:hypothetical protein
MQGGVTGGTVPASVCDVAPRSLVPALFALSACIGGATVTVADGGSGSDAGSVAVTGSDSGSPDGGSHRVPQSHRPVATACTPTVAAGTCTLKTSSLGECTTDAQCTASAGGRCDNNMGGPAGCYCAYPCTDDASCGAGEVCACAGEFIAGRNASVVGACRVDSDCGSGGYCSPSSMQQLGYHCHTATDDCVDDGDCPRPPNTVGSPACGYSLSDRRWECTVISAPN